MDTIKLIDNKGFSWFSSENIFIKGYFFDEENNYYEKEKALLFFKNINFDHQFIKRIKSINGIFTVIIKNNEKLFIACDSTRIFPVFYSNYRNNLFISDQVSYLKEKLNLTKIDELASEEFLASGHTHGKKTLLKNAYQLQSSEYICFENKEIKKQGFHFTYNTKTLNRTPYSKLREQAIIAIENSFKRLIKSLNNKQVLLPLSGGYDSRLIAVLLKKYNYSNVICYTYGKKNNREIENSKRTADALNFKWVFIEYKDDVIENYANSTIFKKYANYIGKFSTMLFMQEYFAVKYLKENRLVSAEAVFLPGHSGDLLGGSQFIKIIPENLEEYQIVDLIQKEKFNNQKTNTNNRIINQLKSFDKNYKTKLPHSVFEDYDIKERLSKIIFNSSGVYSFFNFSYRFFYWDKELLYFFKDVPIEYKEMKLLYDDVLKNHYFNQFKVNFEKELNPSPNDINFQKIKEKIKPLLPYFIKKQFLVKNDWLNSEKITNEMVLSMKKNKLSFNSKIKSFNEINIQWYLYYCKGLIKK